MAPPDFCTIQESGGVGEGLSLSNELTIVQADLQQE